jgi:hypothetical protein
MTWSSGLECGHFRAGFEAALAQPADSPFPDPPDGETETLSCDFDGANAYVLDQPRVGRNALLEQV